MEEWRVFRSEWRDPLHGTILEKSRCLFLPELDLARTRSSRLWAPAAWGRSRAKDTRLKREVAVKVLPEAFARDSRRMARFQRQADVLAVLNLLKIAQIYGAEESALVMELVDGPTLGDLTRQGATNPRPRPRRTVDTGLRARSRSLASSRRLYLRRARCHAGIREPPDPHDVNSRPQSPRTHTP